MASPKNLILTGTPGIGKTTLIKECAYPFVEKLGGFVTEELKEGHCREGFLLKTFQGEKRVLAKKGMASPHKLNKYGIDLSALNNVGIPALKKAQAAGQLLVIDEIGKMEMMSEPFCQFVTSALAGPLPLLATIRTKAEPFTSQVKKMSDTELLVLTRANYPEIKRRVRGWIEDKVQGQERRAGQDENEEGGDSLSSEMREN